jgi:hypothetical protein
VNDKAAVDVPEFSDAAVNVVVPHPDLSKDPSVPQTVIGRTSFTTSSISSFALSKNEYEMDVALAISACPISRIDDVNVASATGVDVRIGAAVMTFDDAWLTVAVRVLRLPVCAAELPDTPLATTMVHCVSTTRSSPATVNVRVAPAAPEFEPAAVKVVVPQPTTEGVAGDAAIVNVGKMSAMVSPAVRGIFKEKINLTGVTPTATG